MAYQDLAGGINSPEGEKTVISASLKLFLFLDKSSKRVQNQRYAEGWGTPSDQGVSMALLPSPSPYGHC